MSRDFRAFPTSTTKTFRIAVVFLILPHLGNVDGGQCSNSIQEDNDRKPRLIAVTEPVQHGEGPHWDAHNQLLYFVDISGNTVHRLNPSTNMHSAITLNDSVSFVIPIRGRVNQFIIGLGRSLAVLHWDGFSPTFQVFVKESVDNDRPNNRFNDAKADPWGRLWTGTMGEEKPIGNVQLNQGRLYRWSMVKCRLEPQLSPVSISNGIAWTNDMKFMYYADSPTRRIDAFDYDGRSIRNRRIIFDFIINNVPGNPDGMTIDRWNMLWIACWGGSRVIQVDPQRSQLLKTILMPVERVTSVTFGGALLDILYVTSMRTGLNETQLKSQPMAGTTFAVTNLGTRGTINNPAQFYCVHRKRLKHYSG
ncbi:regucalcin isoform X1 [Nilaparvata lugens]|uniref:regucalcin isoform X1 n=1 Tax=Nilaparvata lugens TaxID=108931 RepID=UPI000B989ADF|nr:regucalcin isoform X1 [Nilaparvata lugens]